MPDDARRCSDSLIQRVCPSASLLGPWRRGTSRPTRSQLWNAADPRPHLVILLVSVMTVLVGRALDVSDRSRVVIPGVNLSLPGFCAYQRFTGHDCPGCGLTRSFVCLANGDIASAWSYNAVGSVLFVVVVLQIPYRVIQILRLRSGGPAIRLCNELWIIWPFLTALLAQWLIRSIVQLAG